MQSFVKNAMALKTLPINLLTKIFGDGDFIMQNYGVDAGQLQSLVETLPEMVPRQIKKIFFLNNHMKDQMLADFL